MLEFLLCIAVGAVVALGGVAAGAYFVTRAARPMEKEPEDTLDKEIDEAADEAAVDLARQFANYMSYDGRAQSNDQ